MIDIDIARPGHVLRIQATEFKGHDLVDLRLYWNEGEVERPLKKGITFKRDLLPRVIKALQEIQADNPRLLDPAEA